MSTFMWIAAFSVSFVASILVSIAAMTLEAYYIRYEDRKFDLWVFPLIALSMIPIAGPIAVGMCVAARIFSELICLNVLSAYLTKLFRTGMDKSEN